jgi:hypothetical protein
MHEPWGPLGGSSRASATERMSTRMRTFIVNWMGSDERRIFKVSRKTLFFDRRIARWHTVEQEGNRTKSSSVRFDS